MKLLLENWRKYIKENQEINERGWEDEHERQEKHASLEKSDMEKHGCLTVGTFLAMLDAAQADEEDDESAARAKGHAWSLAKKFIKFVGGPIVSLISSGAEIYDILKSTKDALRSDESSVSMETINNFPILKLLKIDPDIISVIDNDVLKALDEKYEKDILRKIEKDTCLNAVPTINEYIKKQILKHTDGQVVAPVDTSK